MSVDSKVWFITGCSSGFGLAITELALKKGDKVVATLRRPEVLSELASQYPETLLTLRLDVTSPSEVISAFSASREKFGHIDFVVNNAGYGVVSEVEGTTDRTARDVFEVNFWGASHVSREAVRFFREENKPLGGRLLQISSLSGIESSVGCVYYCASKFALEALSEGLAAELHPDWNIKITILEPGPFRTKCPTVNSVTDPVHPAYTDPALPTMQWRALFSNPNPAFNGDPDKFAEAVYNAAYLEDPPLRLPIHPRALAVFRNKGKKLIEAADKWESWSEDVLMKD
ncbi:NAD(P)-binding protein [Paxillus ammoniavirescens]|nr:NAD(P)-binding protein [Paxillus ammoniavirescens]